MEVNVFERIKRLTEQRKIPTKKLAAAIGMSEQNYYRMVRENSIKLQTLSKILEFLRIDESDFFSDSFGSNIHPDKQLVTEPAIKYTHSKDTKTALIEKDLQIMETLIKSIRQSLNN